MPRQATASILSYVKHRRILGTPGEEEMQKIDAGLEKDYKQTMY